MASICNSNATSAFIDIATFEMLEKYMYGGDDATAYFVREVRKSTWFSQVPVVLSRASGNPAFNTDWSATISRAGDYLLQVWLRVTFPSVTLAAANQATVALPAATGVGRLRWTRNLMHNLIRETCITFNDLQAEKFTGQFLDMWSKFTVPAGKRNGYDNMIGNIPDLTGPTAAGTAIPSATLNLPLPFFFTRDSGIALPTAALPYNDMRIQFVFRDWNELLILDKTNYVSTTVGGPALPCFVPLASDLTGGAPVLGTTQLWANYAIVSNDERKRMACAPRDILIEQVQESNIQTFNPVNNATPSYDLRFSHAVKVLFFGVLNRTCSNEWSNWQTNTPVDLGTVVNFSPTGSGDPILQTTLTYENTHRLAQMGSDYYSLVQPYYFAPVIPLETGFHMYSYSLDFICIDPMGSTNYGKLTNVSIIPEASAAALTASQGTGAEDTGSEFANSYEFRCIAVSNNVIRISGGAMGFPIL